MSRGVTINFVNEFINATDLRDLIKAKQGAASLRSVAHAIGISDVTLLNFLRGSSQTIDAENTIKLAHWLNIDAASALMGMGHKEVAELLRTPEPQIKDRHLRALSKAMNGLMEYEKDAVVRNAQTLIATLKETRATYQVKANGAKTIGSDKL